MADAARKLRVFVASPGDVSAERDGLAEVINELNLVLAHLVPARELTLELIRWQTHVRPAMGRPQGVINDQIGRFDIFVGIMWKRFGTPTGGAQSGTEEEFRLAYESWENTRTPEVLMYFCTAPPLLSNSAEIDQYKAVTVFREALQSKGLVWTYESATHFAATIRSHLIMVLGQKIHGAQDTATAEKVGRLALEGDSSNLREKALELAKSYERTRSSMEPGDARTRKMEMVVTEMRTMAPFLYPLLSELAHSDSPGQRLLASVVLQQMPSEPLYEWLARRFLEDKPFIAFHAGVALLKAARQPSGGPIHDKSLAMAIARAQDALGAENRASDRHTVLEAATQELARRMQQHRRLSDIHVDILTIMAQQPRTPINVSELINRVRSREEEVPLGNQISIALIELEDLGHVERSTLPGRSYVITVSGADMAKERG